MSAVASPDASARGPAGAQLAPAIVRAVAILEHLAAHADAGATLAEIVRATEISKSSAHNVLATLHSLGLVVRDAGATYRLGPALIRLGAAATRDATPLAVTADLARELAARTGLSLAILQPTPDGRAAQVVSSASPPSGMHVGVTLGDRFEVTDGAVGKVLLAALPPEARPAAIGAAPPAARTARTITRPDLLLHEARATDARGWATSAGEFNENNAVAVAVRGVDGRPALVVVALGFPSQLPEADLPAIGEQVRGLADEATARTGGVTPRGGEE